MTATPPQRRYHDIDTPTGAAAGEEVHVPTWSLPRMPMSEALSLIFISLCLGVGLNQIFDYAIGKRGAGTQVVARLERRITDLEAEHVRHREQDARLEAKVDTLISLVGKLVEGGQSPSTERTAP